MVDHDSPENVSTHVFDTYTQEDKAKRKREKTQKLPVSSHPSTVDNTPAGVHFTISDLVVDGFQSSHSVSVLSQHHVILHGPCKPKSPQALDRSQKKEKQM